VEVMAHTPGPWKAYDNYVEIPGKPLIEVNTDNPMVGDSSNDTHLIAAAPDLLAAAHIAVNAAVIDSDWPGIAELRDAIAKAEGKNG
jgi:hypothetical protein